VRRRPLADTTATCPLIDTAPRQRGATRTIDRKVALNEYPRHRAKHSTSARNTFTAAPFLDNHPPGTAGTRAPIACQNTPEPPQDRHDTIVSDNALYC
jgi:hypothetical protein